MLNAEVAYDTATKYLHYVVFLGIRHHAFFSLLSLGFCYELVNGVVSIVFHAIFSVAESVFLLG